ncbi:outer membrane efflux protein [Emticicia oligotrophica DSM 17448]|uniref:Outer membrane efflux protein n=1 Tax=Emticicia oligotrophica (strain DSM 17448 / CIP 109782 / MTCC 6937 / GPTSA100-15) TaxID=929562 RepID=A0ABM5N5U5_EMTOG|nr:TolC family protein [Emticicia oligotrophica]AFK04904.1 outer membrane efflux protein [Emticicia oligotrophica DSM 17448]
MKKLIFVLLLLGFRVSAQSDTLKLTLKQAEDDFFKENLQLVAAKLGISEGRAYELQAGLRPNPSLYFEHMPYNTQNKELGGFKKNNAEQIIQFQYLVQVAQKRQKAISLAQANTEQAENSFRELIRNLQYQLHATFYDLYFTNQALVVYEQEISTLQQTLNAYQEQFNRGNVPLKDLARLKAYLVSLNTEKQSLIQQKFDDERDLGYLLGSKKQYTIEPVVESVFTNVDFNKLTISDLINIASENRFDLKGALTQRKIEERNLEFQMANKKPDLTFQMTYDRNGSFVQNYLGLGVSMNLPVFNKNQGNIQAAQIRIQEAEKLQESYQLKVEKDVQNAFYKARQADTVAKSIDSKFSDDFSKLIAGVLDNYRKQNITVVEFIDFFDSYKQTILQYNQLQNDRVSAFENLNFTVGKAILN